MNNIEDLIKIWGSLKQNNVDSFLKVKHLPSTEDITLSASDYSGITISEKDSVELYSNNSVVYLDKESILMESENNTRVKSSEIELLFKYLKLNGKLVNNKFIDTKTKEDHIITPSKLLLSLLDSKIKVVLGEPSPEALQTSIELSDLLILEPFTKEEESSVDMETRNRQKLYNLHKDIIK